MHMLIAMLAGVSSIQTLILVFIATTTTMLVAMLQGWRSRPRGLSLTALA